MVSKGIAAVAALAVVTVAAEAPAQPRRPAPAPAARPAAAPARPAAQVVTGPVSTYWMSAETSSGIGAGLTGAAGGARPSLGSIMGAMRNAGAVNHRVTLQLGSSQAPASPAAAHTVPATFGIGPKLNLLSPTTAPPPEPGERTEVPKEFQRPKGRMLIFWGCGAHARPGQPLVLDFAQMTQGKFPPGLANAMKGLDYTPMQPPSPARNKTYGEWPNSRANPSAPPSSSSLVGAHTVEGNYTSAINYTLAQNQDYLPSLGLRTAKAADGSAQLTWTPAAQARAYLAMAVGGGSQDTVALWISTEGQAAAFGLPDYLSPADLTRLVGQRALLPATASSCAVPKEFVDAAPAAFVTLAGYGEEANFSFPPRPADPRTPWNIDWTVKVRYRTADSAILGTDMAAMGGGGGAAQAQRGGSAPVAPTEPPPSARDAVMRGLGSAIGRGLLGGR